MWNASSELTLSGCVISICCVGFLISVCRFIVSKALLISSATVIVRAGGGGIWLNPFATVLFSVCSAVTVECCTRLFGVFVVM